MLGSNKYKVVLPILLSSAITLVLVLKGHKAQELEDQQRLQFALNLEIPQHQVEILHIEVENWTDYHLHCKFRTELHLSDLLAGRNWIEDEVAYTAEKVSDVRRFVVFGNDFDVALSARSGFYEVTYLAD